MFIVGRYIIYCKIDITEKDKINQVPSLFLEIRRVVVSIYGTAC